MKNIYRILLIILALQFTFSCTDNDFSALTEREKTIEVNGKKYPEGIINFMGYWSETAHYGTLTVSVDQNDRYEDTYDTNYYRFHFDCPECPKDGDNLAKMNLKLEVNLSERYDCSYENGDLIVKSVFNKKKGILRFNLKILRCQTRKRPRNICSTEL